LCPNKTNTSQKILHTFKIQIKGLVQGVGFRPFIYKLAHGLNLKGYVENRNDGVLIIITIQPEKLNKFISLIKKNAPHASEIFSITSSKTDFSEFTGFTIRKSQNISEEITDVSPDISVCDLCLDEFFNKSRRFKYPFINCTHCGPRFTIIKDLPYDRPKTSMDEFVMCDQCQHEYEDVTDRRFHAQPIACEKCGPEYSLLINGSKISDLNDIVIKCCNLIDNGKILAIKGMGGFHLCCDALNDQAVYNLRNSKKREGKPFAVMFAEIAELRKFASISPMEEKCFLSWRRPVILVKQKKSLARGISMELSTIGAILPYMPIHYLLFTKLKTKAIVLTSGNISDEPIVIDNNKVVSTLKMADAFLIYNREIHNRTDDSVIRLINNKPRLIRRSRGYVPSPINLSFNCDKILATGAELNNCFCIGKGNQAILSQHIGDLKNYETYDFFTESLERFMKLFRFNPEIVAHDMHPDYLSTSFAKKMKLKTEIIQHHHAHIASVMAENNLDEDVLGVCFDGTGYGTDGHIWGGEFLLCNLSDFKRLIHFEYMPLPGGDKAVEKPWMMALSYLYHIFGKDVFDFSKDIFRNIDLLDQELVIQNIRNKINTPLTSSVGRLFDAVAAITGICRNASFHAEAPMRMESYINPRMNNSYDFEVKDTISFRPAIIGIVEDLKKAKSLQFIITGFHNTVIKAVEEVLIKYRDESGLNKVVFSGGVFQNEYLSSRLEKKLNINKFEVCINQKVPCNDGGISLGQLAIAAKRRTNLCV
jgi:hydrogenase maturation protein HypF